MRGQEDFRETEAFFSVEERQTERKQREMRRVLFEKVGRRRRRNPSVKQRETEAASLP